MLKTCLFSIFFFFFSKVYSSSRCLGIAEISERHRAEINVQNRRKPSKSLQRDMETAESYGISRSRCPANKVCWGTHHINANYQVIQTPSLCFSRMFGFIVGNDMKAKFVARVEQSWWKGVDGRFGSYREKSIARFSDRRGSRHLRQRQFRTTPQPDSGVEVSFREWFDEHEWWKTRWFWRVLTTFAIRCASYWYTLCCPILTLRCTIDQFKCL